MRRLQKHFQNQGAAVSLESCLANSESFSSHEGNEIRLSDCSTAERFGNRTHARCCLPLFLNSVVRRRQGLLNQTRGGTASGPEIQTPRQPLQFNRCFSRRTLYVCGSNGSTASAATTTSLLAESTSAKSTPRQSRRMKEVSGCLTTVLPLTYTRVSEVWSRLHRTVASKDTDVPLVDRLCCCTPATDDAHDLALTIPAVFPARPSIVLLVPAAELLLLCLCYFEQTWKHAPDTLPPSPECDFFVERTYAALTIFISRSAST